MPPFVEPRASSVPDNHDEHRVRVLIAAFSVLIAAAILVNLVFALVQGAGAGLMSILSAIGIVMALIAWIKK